MTFHEIDGPWIQHAAFEDLGACLFDADMDGDLDLYVTSGSNEFPINSELYQDRLYLNELGSFSYDINRLPQITVSGSRVISLDYDNDGDHDIVVGGRQATRKVSVPVSTLLLENESGFFRDVTRSSAPDLIDVGMVTDVQAFDYNKDGLQDLLLVGEWMSPTVMENSGMDLYE